MRQRGNVYVYLACAIAILGICTALFFGYKGQLDEADKKGYARGASETDAAYKTRDNKQLQQVIAERDALRKEKDEKEAAHDAAVGLREEKHAQEIADADARYSQLLTRYRGIQRVPRQAGGGACPPSDKPGGAATATADPGSGAGPLTRGELLGPDGEFLIREARRANALIAKIKECRGVLEDERK